MDHLDLPSLKALPRNATVIACTKCAALIRPLGFSDVRELKWGESTTMKGLTVTAMAANHWGKRWPPWGVDYGFNSYVLECAGHRMLLACDSAYTDAFAALAEPSVRRCRVLDRRLRSMDSLPRESRAGLEHV